MIKSGKLPPWNDLSRMALSHNATAHYPSDVSSSYQTFNDTDSEMNDSEMDDGESTVASFVSSAPANGNKTKKHCCTRKVKCGIGLSVAFLMVAGAITAVVIWRMVVNRGNDNYNTEPWIQLVPPSRYKICPYLNQTVGSFKLQPPELLYVADTEIILCWEKSFWFPSYELQRDDWWFNKPQHTIYSGNSTSYNATGPFVPASTYNFRVRGHYPNGTAGPWSGTEPATTPGNGNCANAQDVGIYKRKHDTLKADIQNCLISCLDDADCSLKCLTSQVGLTSNCAKCWITEGGCTIKFCFDECLDPHSQGCKACSKEKCLPACIDCSGLPAWVFPP